MCSPHRHGDCPSLTSIYRSLSGFFLDLFCFIISLFPFFSFLLHHLYLCHYYYYYHHLHYPCWCCYYYFSVHFFLSFFLVRSGGFVAISLFHSSLALLPHFYLLLVFMYIFFVFYFFFCSFCLTPFFIFSLFFPFRNTCFWVFVLPFVYGYSVVFGLLFDNDIQMCIGFTLCCASASPSPNFDSH